MSSLNSADPVWVSLGSPSDGDPCLTSGSTIEHPSSSSERSSEASTRARSGRGSRGPRPRLFAKGKCQADGCSANLLKLPFYYQRNHICTNHNKAASFFRQGEEVRFCQRCGLTHPLGEYEGDKRSCRRQLERHNVRRRRLASKRAAETQQQQPASAEGGNQVLAEDWRDDPPPPEWQLEGIGSAEFETAAEQDSSGLSVGASLNSAALEAASQSCVCRGSCCCSGADDDVGLAKHVRPGDVESMEQSSVGDSARSNDDDDDACSTSRPGPEDGSLDGPGKRLSAPALEGALCALQRQHADAYGYLVCRQLELAGALLAAAAGIVARTPTGSPAVLTTA